MLAHHLLVGIEGAIVRAGALQVARDEQLHEVLGRGCVVAQGRRHHISGSMAPVMVPAVAAINTKPRSGGLAVDPLTLAARLRNHGRGLLAHDVHDVHRRVDGVGNHDGAMGGLGLQLLWPREHMPLWARHTCIEDLLLLFVDDIAVFCVNLDESAVLFRRGEHVVDVIIAQHERTFVGHENFERVHPFLFAQHLQVLLGVLVPVGNRHVERVVTVDLGVCLLAPNVVRLKERLPLVGDNKVDQHGCPSSNSSSRTVVEVIDRHCPHEGHLAVSVGVDATWDNHFSCGINDPSTLWCSQISTNTLDDAIFDQHIGLEGSV
mmetsp:Transcript_33798/g.84817  ORF Transcript_33798/g.84817 Transcript_33798/m.84817 type:complete len:320 (-) Transcript_33798:137-1096(-)